MNQHYREPRPGNIRLGISKSEATPTAQLTSLWEHRLAFLLIGSVSTSIVINTTSAFAEPPAIDRGSLTPRLAVSDSLNEPVNTINNPIALANRPTKKVAQASDISGNWAEPFIKALVEKDIIKGYPDGTFKPDRPPR